MILFPESARVNTLRISLILSGIYFDKSAGQLTSVSAPVTSVSGTTPDYDSPVVSGVSMSPTTGTIGTTVTVTVIAKDALSGLNSMDGRLKCHTGISEVRGISFYGSCDNAAGVCTVLFMNFIRTEPVFLQTLR